LKLMWGKYEKKFKYKEYVNDIIIIGN
jgi:hypothetical protein